MIESAEMMMTLIRNEIESIDESMHTESNSFKLIMTISRMAALDFSDSLMYQAESIKYYFSDSTFDEICNPAALIGDIAEIMSAFYEGEKEDIINQFHGIINLIEMDIEYREEAGFMFDSFENAIDAFESIIKDRFKK